MKSPVALRILAAILAGSIAAWFGAAAAHADVDTTGTTITYTAAQNILDTTFTGNGTLNFNGSGVIGLDNSGGFHPDTFSMTGGSITVQSGVTLRNGGWCGGIWTDNLASLNLAGGATLDVWDGNTVRVDALTGAGTVTHTNWGDLTNLTIGVNNGSGTFSGTITETFGHQTSLTKNGTGTLTLTGANTYTGGTSITGGVLACVNAFSLGSGALVIYNGAKLQMNYRGTRQVASLSLNGGTAQAIGTYGSTNSAATQKNDTYFSGTGTITVGNVNVNAAPVVTNVHGEQRPNTHLVDVYYDIADTNSSSVSVRLEVSDDEGSNWAVPVASVSQSVGPGVTPGLGKHILWNAGADWDGQYSKKVRFRVTASETPNESFPEGFALIPAGEFQMGNALSASGDGWDDELPVHPVYVSAFYMGKYEVTKELWDEVRAWGMANGRGYTDLAVGNKGANHPVHSITWYDMVKWCNARSEKEGLIPCYRAAGAVYKTTNDDAVVCNWSANGYRLPTEAEWEKAARGGLSGKRFPWGDRISLSQANYYGHPSSFDYDDGPAGFHPTYAGNGYPYTSPVGSFAANGYGLYDMAGNVWEGCWDLYDVYTDASQVDPRGPATSPYGPYRVIRGGGWDYYAYGTRCAYRDSGWSGSADIHDGFRLARGQP